MPGVTNTPIGGLKLLPFWRLRGIDEEGYERGNDHAQGYCII